jgi:hypothetical protein
MRFNYSTLSQRPSLFHRLTGLTLAEFDVLLDKFSSHYFLMVVSPKINRLDRKRTSGGGRHGYLYAIEDKLLFILIYTRIYPLLIVQGMFFGLAESKACKWVGILLPVLDTTLDSAHVRPKRLKGKSLEEIIEEFPELKDMGVLTDGVESPIQRPKDVDKEKQHFSGKKQHHTKKRVTFVHPKTQFILATSSEHPGCDHDKKIIDEEEVTCQSELDVGADRGFIGLSIGKANIITPIKRKARKSKNDPKIEFTEEQKAYNKSHSQARIAVEHSNAGFKRNRSVKDILRNTRDGMSDQLSMVAMGLHNLRVVSRSSYQAG